MIKARLMHANERQTRANDMMRLIVSGPRNFSEIEFMTLMLNRITFQYDDVVLVTCQQPDKEHLSMFPPAEEWFRKKWGKGWKGYNKTVRYYPNYEGEKKWNIGMKEMRMEMVTGADALVAFWDVGNNDFHTEELIRIAQVYDLKTKVFRV